MLQADFASAVYAKVQVQDPVRDKDVSFFPAAQIDLVEQHTDAGRKLIAIPGNSYFIREIRDEIRLTNRLSSMGILAGTRIEVCQNHKKQPVLLFASDTLVAIGSTECTKIVIGGECNE